MLINEAVSQWSVGELSERTSGISSATQATLNKFDQSIGIAMYWDSLSLEQQDEINLASQYQNCL